jgi:hyperosmotically inducible periplasmic protein
MKHKATLKLVPGLLLGLALAAPAFAQSSSDSMHEAWHSTENAASHAWQGTKTAVKDTDITAKVKIALHNDKLTKGHDIHVDTRDGDVTLTGHAPSAVADRAERIARETTGVVSVNNVIRPSESMSSR